MAVEQTPNSPAVQWVTTFSTVVVALIGLDHFSIIWGLVGAMVAQTRSPAKGRARAVAGLVVNTLIGALFGSAIASVVWPNSPQARYLLCCLMPLILSKVLFRFTDAVGDAMVNSVPAFVSRAMGATPYPAPLPPATPPVQAPPPPVQPYRVEAPHTTVKDDGAPRPYRPEEDEEEDRPHV